MDTADEPDFRQSAKKCILSTRFRMSFVQNGKLRRTLLMTIAPLQTMPNFRHLADIITVARFRGTKMIIQATFHC